MQEAVLQLLRAIAPECINDSLILGGATEHERELNAKLAICDLAPLG